MSTQLVHIRPSITHRLPLKVSIMRRLTSESVRIDTPSKIPNHPPPSTIYNKSNQYLILTRTSLSTLILGKSLLYPSHN